MIVGTRATSMLPTMSSRSIALCIGNLTSFGARPLQHRVVQQRNVRQHASSGAADLPPGWGPRKDSPSIWQRIKHFFVGDKLDKERIKALGMGAFASYGFISNLNYGSALGMAWLAFVKRYGVSPMAPGQWPAFLAFYAGFWALQNFARPLRLSLALALAPAFDRGITAIGEKLHVSKAIAFGLFLFCMAVITTSTLFGSLYLLGGFPPTPATT